MLTDEDIAIYSAIFNKLAPEDLTGLAELAVARHLAAGEIYIRKGSESQKLAFIQKGLIRAFLVKPNDDEITLMLRWENQFVASIDSIFRRKPSRFVYQAVEDTILLELDYTLARPIIEASHGLSASRDEFMMMMLAQALDRIETFVLLSPEERYLKLLEEKAGLVERVPDKYLATMLGITPVSLSRMRRRLANSKKTNP